MLIVVIYISVPFDGIYATELYIAVNEAKKGIDDFRSH